MAPCGGVRVSEESPGEVLVKGLHSCSKDPSILETLVPWDDCWGQQQVWSCSGLSAYKTSHVYCGWLHKPIGAQKIVNESQMSDIELVTLSDLGFGLI